LSEGKVSLAWGSTGGCGPFSGLITATYSRESDPYAKYEVGSQNGKQTDAPERRDEGKYTVVYVLTLSDAKDQNLTARATVDINFID
jgi:hypothetical protein